MPQLSPITNTLEEELKRELRQRGIVVWLDKDGHYNAYVDELAERYRKGDFFAPVVAFRGSYLEMMLALEPYGNGLDPEALLIHMPGHNEENIRKTPVFELYKPGYRFRKALDTLIREAGSGYVGPAEIETYLSSNTPTLADAEAWLQKALSQPKQGFADYLDSLTPEWVLDGLVGKEQVLRSHVTQSSDLADLTDYLYRHTGMDQSFLSFFLGSTLLSFQTLGQALAGWLMCVEYANDLIRQPYLDILKPLQTLAIPFRKTCDRLINHLRQQHADIYITYADIAETHLQQELDEIRPEDLGQIDTFKREETSVLDGAIDALLKGNWTKVLAWAQLRIEKASFWLQRDPARKLVWSLVQDAAILGQAIGRSDRPLQGVTTLREALDTYTQNAYEVDRLHRRFEQQRLNLLEPTLPHFTQLLEVANHLRVKYRAWADQLAVDFSSICESEGFLPEDDLQQRTLYDQVLHPLTQSKAKVAFFIIDAFRYEMAADLASAFEGAGTTVTLKGRYAELPSITAVGMNVLAPVTKAGRLTLAGTSGFKGFKTGEYTVSRPDERVRAMGDRSLGSTSSGRPPVKALSLGEVCDRSTAKLKQSCGDASLIVVHSKELDDAGEANVGLATFETYLQQIKAAWSHLKSIGVNEFVFTADHGFLLQDHTTQEKIYGTKRIPNRRYILETEPRSEEGIATVSFSALKYEGQDGYLLFRKDTAVFATGNTGATFVHGGNSLQERIIPVLMVSHRYQANLAMTQYLIEAEVLPEVLGFNRIRIRLKPAPVAQGVLSFVGASQINLGLHVPNRPDILVNLKQVVGAEVNNQQFRVEVDGGPVEVIFDLKGQRDERVRLEVYHPEETEKVQPITLSTFFDVAGSLRVETPEPAQVSSSGDWQDSFDDPAIRGVFTHLERHGSLTELELTQMLGSPTSARRFARKFDEYVTKVPFSVRIEVNSSGKRYVKQV